MKKYNKLVGILMVGCMFGVIIGIQLNTMIGGDIISLYKNEIEAQELVELQKTTEDMKTKIEDFKNQVEKLEKERAEKSVSLKKLKSTVNEYKFLAGYSPGIGPGVTIVLESSSIDTNIAEIMEEKRYLINLINELKVFGAEMLSINNYRIVGRTEIVLAGNHINVNGVSIAQPYIIQAIGDPNSLKRYVKHGSILFELMELDGITSNIKFSDKIEIFPLTKEKPLEYVKAADE